MILEMSIVNKLLKGISSATNLLWNENIEDNSDECFFILMTVIFILMTREQQSHC
jgi:hypothetical protein